MSIATLILGQSGTGKSTSLRNLNPKQVLLIQAIKNPFLFVRLNGLIGALKIKVVQSW